ncbi:glycosyltransferase family 4 protein [Sulfitobacter sp. 1A05707]|uniref:glycosyltransferase family 4 protein n=1 Tax=Sulfitobacter sp. 1A05707 TaxID=3368560 RepID=UPI003745075F
MTDTKIKVLICCFPSDLSGVPSYVRQICTLDPDRFNITILTQSRGAAFTPEILPNNVDVICVEELRNSMSFGSLLTFRRALLRCVRAIEPDVLHLNGTMFAAAGRLISLPRGCRRIVTYHGVPFGPGLPLKQKLILLPLETVLLNASDSRNIMISKKDFKTISKFNLTRRKLDYVLNSAPAIRLSAFSEVRSEDGPIRIISVAVFRPQKDYELLLSSFGKLGPDYELLLVGRGTDGSEMRQLAETNAGAAALRRIKFMGERSDVPDLLAKSDVFVLTSRYEGMPIAALEALSAGMPIVMMDVGGAEEICSEGSGLIVHQRSPKAVANAISELSASLRDGTWDKSLSRTRHAMLFEECLFLNKMKRIYEDGN